MSQSTPIGSTTKNHNKTLLSIAVSMALGCVSFTGLAEETTPVDEAVVEKILVTATKRTTNQQDVAASMSSLTTSDIENQGIDDLDGVMRNLPGVVLNQPIRNRSFINIRGIATSVAGVNTQDPVSVYINDMPVTDTFGASVQPDLRLYDVERVEVLRGPQGTLFGSGSLGGTVRVITNKPVMNELSGSFRADWAHTDSAGTRQRFDGMVNVPLIDDTLALRAVGYYRDEAGWVENTVINTRNSTEDHGGRLSLKWTPAEALSATFEVLYQNSKPEDGDAWNPELGQFTKASTILEGRPSELTSFNATIEYDMPDFATLVSSTSSTTSETAVRIDYGDITGLGFPLLAQNEPWKVDFLSQELRLVSNTSSALDWVAGLFYIDRKSVADFSFTLPGLADFINDAVAPGLMEDDVFLLTTTTTKSQEIAGFGEVGIELADQWRATFGMRVSSTEVSINEPARYVLNFATFTKDVASFENSGKDSSVVTWRTSLSYQPSRDLHFYASASTGYRIGQTNPFIGASPVDPTDPLVIPNLYKPDETLNYEVGAKTEFWNNKVRLNAAAYLIKWTDIQVDAIRQSDAANFIANAGKAESKGIEVELVALPVSDLELNFSASVQNAKIVEISDEQSFRSGVVKGDTLPGSVDFQVAASAQYYWSLDNGSDMYVRLAGQYVDSSPNGFSKLAGTDMANPYLARNEAYENVEAALGVIVDHWEFTLYGENLTNNDKFILNSGGSAANSVTTLRPRTIGLRAHYRFY